MDKIVEIESPDLSGYQSKIDIEADAPTSNEEFRIPLFYNLDTFRVTLAQVSRSSVETGWKAGPLYGVGTIHPYPGGEFQDLEVIKYSNSTVEFNVISSQTTGTLSLKVKRPSDSAYETIDLSYSTLSVIPLWTATVAADHATSSWLSDSVDPLTLDAQLVSDGNLFELKQGTAGLPVPQTAGNYDVKVGSDGAPVLSAPPAFPTYLPAQVPAWSADSGWDQNQVVSYQESSTAPYELFIATVDIAYTPIGNHVPPLDSRWRRVYAGGVHLDGYTVTNKDFNVVFNVGSASTSSQTSSDFYGNVNIDFNNLPSDFHDFQGGGSILYASETMTLKMKANVTFDVSLRAITGGSGWSGYLALVYRKNNGSWLSAYSSSSIVNVAANADETHQRTLSAASDIDIDLVDGDQVQFAWLGQVDSGACSWTLFTTATQTRIWQISGSLGTEAKLDFDKDGKLNLDVDGAGPWNLYDEEGFTKRGLMVRSKSESLTGQSGVIVVPGTEIYIEASQGGTHNVQIPIFSRDLPAQNRSNRRLTLLSNVQITVPTGSTGTGNLAVVAGGAPISLTDFRVQLRNDSTGQERELLGDSLTATIPAGETLDVPMSMGQSSVVSIPEWSKGEILSGRATLVYTGGSADWIIRIPQVDIAVTWNATVGSTDQIDLGPDRLPSHRSSPTAVRTHMVDIEGIPEEWAVPTILWSGGTGLWGGRVTTAQTLTMSDDINKYRNLAFFWDVSSTNLNALEHVIIPSQLIKDLTSIPGGSTGQTQLVIRSSRGSTNAGFRIDSIGATTIAIGSIWGYIGLRRIYGLEPVRRYT